MSISRYTFIQLNELKQLTKLFRNGSKKIETRVSAIESPMFEPLHHHRSKQPLHHRSKQPLHHRSKQYENMTLADQAVTCLWTGNALLQRWSITEVLTFVSVSRLVIVGTLAGVTLVLELSYDVFLCDSCLKRVTSSHQAVSTSLLNSIQAYNTSHNSGRK